MPGEQEAAASDDRVASEKLRYVIEAELPRPIAQEFARLRGAHGAAAGPSAANLLGHVLRHAVVVLAAAHAAKGWPRELRTRFADELRKPQSLGQQLGLARSLAEALDRADPGHAATRIAALLLDRVTRQHLDDAVTLRNAVIKKGEVDAGDDLKRAVLALVREVLFLRELPIVEVVSCKERAGAQVMEVRFLVGTEDTALGRVESDLALMAGRVYLLDPIARAAVDLHPLYVIASQRLAWLARASNPPEYETGDGKATKLPSLVEDVAELLDGRPRKTLAGRFLTVRGDARDVARRQLRPGDVVDGRYRVVRLIGEGGMAHVYEVEDRVDGAARALKVLPYEYIRDRTMVTRFRREAEETRSLDHPNVMPTLRFGEDFGDNFLVMPLAAGWPMPDGQLALDASQLSLPLPIADAVMIAKQVAEALHYVHAKGVVHRDLKPRNLLLDADRVVRLSDFGVAGTAESMTLTMTGLGVGTPEYMAPEQIDGAEPAPAADLYALGATLYHLLTGAPPFAGKTPLAIMQAVTSRPPPDPRKLRVEIPLAVSKLVRQLLAKDPADRPRSAHDVFRALSKDTPEQPDDDVDPAGPPPLGDGELLGNVRVGRLVLRTAESSFYEARQLSVPRAVTLRVWPGAEDISTDRRLAWARSRLRHVAIVQTIDLLDDPARGFHVLMEALPPVTLQRLIDVHGPLAFTRAVRFVKQLAAAAIDAVTEGLMLDLTPARLFIATEQDAEYIKVLELVPAQPERASDVDLRALVELLVTLIGGAPIPGWLDDVIRSAQAADGVESVAAFLAALDHGSGPPALPAAGSTDGARVLAGRYRLDRRLREDSLGEWFDAEDVSMKQRRCVRVFHPEISARGDAIRRYADVAISVGRLAHPAVHHVWDVVPVPDGVSYAVMDPIEGRDLVELIERDGPMTVERALRLGTELARALADVHRAGLFHGDVKPSNVLTSTGVGRAPKLLDFGAHELLYGAPEGRGPLMLPVGSPHTIAPELLLGEAWPGTSTDVYGLGVVLYFAVTGHLPTRDGPTPPSTIIPDVSAGLDAVILRALARDPGARYASADALAEALKRPDEASDGTAPTQPRLGTRLGAGKLRLDALAVASPVSLFYDAVDVESGRRVTVRLRNPALRGDQDDTVSARRFAWTTASIKHPSVLQLYDVDTDPRWGLYAVMEPRDGITLEELVRRDGKLPLTRALGLTRQLARAIAAAHALHIFPADLTPSRLFVTTSGSVERVRIAEFGLHDAELRDRAVGEHPDRVHTLGPGRVVDTKRPAAVDVYALGVVLHYLLTGELPVRGNTTFEVIAAHDGPVSPPSQAVPTIPRAVDAVVARALAKDPTRRWPSIRAFAVALDELEGASSARIIRSPWFVAGIGAVVVAAAAWVWWPGPTSRGAVLGPDAGAVVAAPADAAPDSLVAAIELLRNGKTCEDRRAAIPRLVALADPGAIVAIQEARYRLRSGDVLGPGQQNTNACLKADAEAAVEALGGGTPPEPR